MNNNNLQQELSAGLIELELSIKPESQRLLIKYLELIEKWNKTYNLTAIRDPKVMVVYHLLDSLAVLKYLWPGNWLDVGCGAGIPGIVLAIAKPEWTFTLLDSNSKKTSFVQQAIIDLELKNVIVNCERVEKWENKEKFDGIISRAFTETANFIKLTRHLLKVNGRWAAMKGSPEEELKQLPNDVTVEKIISLEVPKIEGTRCLVLIRENK